MKNIKYVLMSIFLLNSGLIFSMEDFPGNRVVSNGKNEIRYDLENNDLKKNLNKNLKGFINLLPKEIWLEILSYLKYEDNRKAFIQFWAYQVGVSDDLTLKMISIDFYRFAILNSKSLKEWSRRVNNFGKSWNNKELVKVINSYLDILNKDFIDDIKFYNSCLYKLKNTKEVFWDKKIENFKEKYTYFDFAFHSEKQNIPLILKNCDKPENKYIYDHNCLLGLLDLKKCIMMHNAKKSFLLNFIKNRQWSQMPYISLFPFVFFAYWTLSLIEIAPEIRFTSIAALSLFTIYIIYLFLMKEHECIPGFLESKDKIEKYLKENKISFSLTDQHFLKVLGHESKIEDITDLEIDDSDFEVV